MGSMDKRSLLVPPLGFVDLRQTSVAAPPLLRQVSQVAVRVAELPLRLNRHVALVGRLVECRPKAAVDGPSSPLRPGDPNPTSP